MLSLKSLILSSLACLAFSGTYADQVEQAKVIDNIYTEALVNGVAIDNLNYLVKHYPGRLSGSDTVSYTHLTLPTKRIV